MSSAGFVVRGDHGLIQIDANYRGLKLIKTVTLSPLGSGYAYYEMDYTPTPMVRVAFRETTGRWFRPLWHVGPVGWYEIVPSGWYEHVPPSGAKMSIYCETTSSGANIQAYIYDVPPAPPSSMAGMVIYDASGNVAFDTEGQHMRVQSFASGYVSLPTGDIGQLPDGPIDAYQLPSGNYAVCPIVEAAYAALLGGWDELADYVNYYRITSNSVETRLIGRFVTPPSGEFRLWSRIQYSAMILKV